MQKKASGFRNMNDLAGGQAEPAKTEGMQEFAAAAALKTKKHPGGRPKATAPAKNGRTVYLTDEELEKVLPYISRISFSVFVKQLLEEKGIL